MDTGNDEGDGVRGRGCGARGAGQTREEEVAQSEAQKLHVSRCLGHPTGSHFLNENLIVNLQYRCC